MILCSLDFWDMIFGDFSCYNDHLIFLDKICMSEYPELNLTELETTLIAKNILFMKIIKLPSSRMKVIKDRTVCVPIDEATIKQTLQSLPRTPNEAGNVLHPVNWIVLHDVEDTKVYNSQGQGEYSRERRRNWKGQDCQASRVCGQAK